MTLHALVAPDWFDSIGRRLRAGSCVFEGALTLRYFFHIYDDAVTLDSDGMELASIEVAVAMAKHDLGQIIADELKHAGTVNPASRIDVAVQDGQVVASVRFDDLLES